MSAFWIARAKWKDLEGQQRYGQMFAKIRQEHLFETLARSTHFQVMEGTEHFDGYVLHKFPSMAAALALYNSPEYQEAAAVRRASCDGCELVIIEGEEVFRGS